MESLDADSARVRDQLQLTLPRFECPVTIIVGQNGAGKTTLIEALRMATTGKHPLPQPAPF